MAYIGTHFGMGIGKDLVVLTFIFIGLFIGLHKKILSSSIIFFLCYIGSLFSQGNGRIYTVLLGFLIGLHISKKVGQFFKKKQKNKLVSFFL